MNLRDSSNIARYTQPCSSPNSEDAARTADKKCRRVSSFRRSGQIKRDSDIGIDFSVELAETGREPDVLPLHGAECDGRDGTEGV